MGSIFAEKGGRGWTLYSVVVLPRSIDRRAASIASLRRPVSSLKMTDATVVVCIARPVSSLVGKPTTR